MDHAKPIAWDTLLTTALPVAVGYAALRIFGEKLGTSMTINGGLTLALGIFVGTLIVKFFQKKKWVPKDI